MNIAITGAASGLGKVVAERFSAAGHRVFGCDVSKDGIADLAGRGSVSLAKCVDVSDPRQIEAWFSDIFAQTARLDVLVNNVGVAGPHADVTELSLKDWHATLNANLHSALVTMQLA
ncbi:MAG: SDR family oxidoreductase, partial [Gammaproteobacteria bacterium]